MKITHHSKQRIVERDAGVVSVAEAKKVAKQAFSAGKTIGHYDKYPKFQEYLRKKRAQAVECSIRVYRGNIYIWRGHKKSLVTAHPIPDRFQEEIESEE